MSNDVPFMLQQSTLPNGGVGFGSNGVMNMGMWGSQPAVASAQSFTGNGIPFAPKYGGFGGSGTRTGFGGWWDSITADLGDGMTGFYQGVSAFSNLAGIYAGFKSLGLAKDQFKFAKSSFNKNFNASAQAYNNTLKDQWEHKTNTYADRGRSYESMDSWMADRQINQTGKKKDQNGNG